MVKKFKIGTGLAAIAVAVIAAGCAAPLERRAASEPVLEGEGRSWSLLFGTPSMQLAQAGSDPSTFAEYSRNDRHMNVQRSDVALTARDQWPERERASLSYPRRVYLDTRPNVIQFYENESRYRSRAYPSTGRSPSVWYWGY